MGRADGRRRLFFKKAGDKDTNYIFPMTNVTVLSVFRTHAQKEYRKVLKMKSTSILYILVLLYTLEN